MNHAFILVGYGGLWKTGLLHGWWKTYLNPTECKCLAPPIPLVLASQIGSNISASQTTRPWTSGFFADFPVFLPQQFFFGLILSNRFVQEFEKPLDPDIQYRGHTLFQGTRLRRVMKHCGNIDLKWKLSTLHCFERNHLNHNFELTQSLQKITITSCKSSE